MTCRRLVTVVAFVAMAGVGAGQARTQATAPAAKKAASAEKREKKEVAEAHGGQVRIVTSGPGGSIFAASLPR